MKKFAIIAFAALLVASFTVPASALDADFGGYFRTRFFSQQNFDGTDSEARDITRTDTRTRLYFTAKINDNLKFVNKFEFNGVWGQPDSSQATGTFVTPAPAGGVPGTGTAVTRVASTSYTDIGADGNNQFVIKNSYADFNLGMVNFMVGVQGAVLARGFLFDDDFAGIRMNIKPNNQLAIPFYWIKGFEAADTNVATRNDEDFDVDYYAVAPIFNISDMFYINPYALYIYSKDASRSSGFGFDGLNKVQLYYLGADLDIKLKNASLWFTGIYQFGTLEEAGSTDEIDVAASLFGAGGQYNFGAMDIHGRAFWASGQDNSNDLTAFTVPRGQSYYWAEIMGHGIFDNQDSINAPGATISNIIAAGIGVGFKPMDKLKITADIWTAALAEDIVSLSGEEVSDLGTEIDLVLTYELVKGLNLDVVGAWLIAGKATTLDAANEDDPIEIGTRLSLSF